MQCILVTLTSHPFHVNSPILVPSPPKEEKIYKSGSICVLHILISYFKIDPGHIFIYYFVYLRHN